MISNWAEYLPIAGIVVSVAGIGVRLYLARRERIARELKSGA